MDLMPLPFPGKATLSHIATNTKDLILDVSGSAI